MRALLMSLVTAGLAISPIDASATDARRLDPRHVETVVNLFSVAPETSFTVACYMDGLDVVLRQISEGAADEREYTARLLFHAGILGIASLVAEQCDRRNPQQEFVRSNEVAFFRRIYIEDARQRDLRASARCLSFRSDSQWEPLLTRCDAMGKAARDYAQ